MLIELWIFFSILAFGSMILSFLRKDILFLPMVSFTLFVVVALASFDIEKPFCSYETDTWTCHTYSERLSGIPYLFFFFAIAEFVFFIFNGLTETFSTWNVKNNSEN